MSPRKMPTEHLASAWTAVAVSGAAFSPAMGKMTRPERSLLAIANLRLGLWYPNPRVMQEESDWYRSHRMPRPWYLVKEMFGVHRTTDRWVYVTDGGHYENLGLVELLRGECSEIYCLDAAGDQTDTFGTFSDAARLARAELGIDIHLDPAPLRPEDDGLAPTGVVAGWFERPPDASGTRKTGWIVLAKLVVPRDAPHDIADLARTVPGFPTNPTQDQLYTDQKFEAYRALGEHLGARAADTGRLIRKALEGTPGDATAMESAVEKANSSLVPPAPAAKPTEVRLDGRVRLRP